MTAFFRRVGTATKEWRKSFQTRLRPLPLALLAAGVMLPFALQEIWPGLQATAQAAGVAVMGVSFMLLTAASDRRLETMLVEVEVLTHEVDRLNGQDEQLNDDVADLRSRLNGEQRNLGMVAGGLGELRQMIQLERQNLSAVAHNAEAIRGDLRTLAEALDDVAARVTASLARQENLEAEMLGERRNLGMVAGALDDVRRLAAGVDRFDARQAAFEHALIEMADRMDCMIGETSPSASTVTAPGADN